MSWYTTIISRQGSQDDNSHSDEESARQAYTTAVEYYNASYTIQLYGDGVLVESSRGQGSGKAS